MDAVDLEFISLQAVAQLFHLEFRAVEDGLKADLAAEYQISRRVGGGLFQLYRGVGDVHIDDGVVVLGGNAKCKAVPRERNAQCAFRAAFGLIELEGRRAQVHAALLHGSVLVDNEFAAVILVPRCRDGGRQQRRPACKGEVFPVFALIIAVDEGGGLSILPFQCRKRRIVRHILHRHAAVDGENAQPLGIDGGIDLVRFAGDGLRQLRQAAEAPKEVGGNYAINAAIIEIITDLIPALHPGVAGAAGRRYADPVRQIDLDGAAVAVAISISIIVRQPHKGIGPVVAVRIDLGDIVVAPSAPRRIVLRRIQIFHLAGEHGVFGGKHFLRCMIVDGAAQLEGGAVRGVSVTHGGKAAEGIAPSCLKLNAQRAIRIRAGDLDSVNACQNAPCAFRRQLYDLIVDRGRSCDGFPGHRGRQVVLHLDGLCSAVRRFVHRDDVFQAEFGGMHDIPLVISGALKCNKITIRHLPVCGVGAVRRRGRGERAVLPHDHAKIIVSQFPRPAGQRFRCHGTAVDRPNISQIGRGLHGQQAQQQTQRQ